MASASDFLTRHCNACYPEACCITNPNLMPDPSRACTHVSDSRSFHVALHERLPSADSSEGTLLEALLAANRGRVPTESVDLLDLFFSFDWLSLEPEIPWQLPAITEAWPLPGSFFCSEVSPETCPTTFRPRANDVRQTLYTSYVAHVRERFPATRAPGSFGVHYMEPLMIFVSRVHGVMLKGVTQSSDIAGGILPVGWAPPPQDWSPRYATVYPTGCLRGPGFQSTPLPPFMKTADQVFTYIEHLSEDDRAAGLAEARAALGDEELRFRLVDLQCVLSTYQSICTDSKDDDLLEFVANIRALEARYTLEISLREMGLGASLYLCTLVFARDPQSRHLFGACIERPSLSQRFATTVANARIPGLQLRPRLRMPMSHMERCNQKVAHEMLLGSEEVPMALAVVRDRWAPLAEISAQVPNLSRDTVLTALQGLVTPAFLWEATTRRPGDILSNDELLLRVFILLSAH